MPTTDHRQYDARTRPPALSRTGYILIGLVPILLAAIGIGILKLDFSDPNSGGTQLRVATSDWIPGQETGTSPIQGVLGINDQHCPFLTGQDGARIWPVWPAGYRATLTGDHYTLIDGKGNDVAHAGDTLAMTGDVRPASAYAGEPCLPKDGEVAVVQSQVSAHAAG